MKQLVFANKVLFTTVGGLLGSVFGDWDGFIFALIVFISIDYISGLMAAVVEKKLSSAVGFRGLFKKVVILMLVAMGQIIDTHILKQGGIIRTAVIFYYLDWSAGSRETQTNFETIKIGGKIRWHYLE